MYKDNVIDFQAVLDKKARKTRAKTSTSMKHEVVDISQRRAEILKQERREVKRTILTEFISAHVVVPEQGLCKVNLYDISENGLAFELDKDRGSFVNGESLAFRIYLNHQTYFPFFVKVNNLRWIAEENVYRVGVEYLKESFNSEALEHFVKFIESISANLKNDSGDVMVSSLK